MRVASLPSSVIAHLAMTHGRPVAISLRYGASSQFASALPHADLALNAGRLQLRDAAAADLLETDPASRPPRASRRRDERLRARRRLALMAARFERDVDRRARRALAGLGERVHFGVRSAELLVTSFADDLAVAHDHAADHRVRLDGALAAHGQRQRLGHVAVVVVGAACHDSRLIAADLGRCPKSRFPAGRPIAAGRPDAAAAGSAAPPRPAAGAGSCVPWRVRCAGI